MIRFNYLFLLSIILLSACGGKNVEPTIIPGDVAAVVSIDFKAMSSKAMEWKDILNPDFFESADLNDEDADAISKLIGSGVDLNKTAYVFVKADKDAQQNYVAATMGLKDASKFEEGIKKLENAPKITKKGNRQYAIRDKTIISWDKESMLLSSSEDEKNLEKIHQSILDTKSSASLETKNKDFKSFLSRKYDIGFWVDYAKISQSGINDMSMLDVPSSLQDLTRMTESVSFWVNFNQGELVLDAETKVNKELVEKYKDLFKGQINNELVKITPVESPLVMLGLGIGMKGLKKVLEDAGYLENAEDVSKMIDVKVDDIFEMLSGDAVFALESMNLENIFNPEIQGSISLGIRNKETLQKLFKKFDGLFLQKKNNYYALRTGGMGQYYIIDKGDKIILTSNEIMRDNAIKNTNTLNSTVTALANDKLSVMYIDIQKIIRSLPKDMINDPMLEKEVLPKFISIQASADDYSNGLSKSNTILKMSEKNRNALAIIIEILKKVSDKKQQKVGA